MHLKLKIFLTISTDISCGTVYVRGYIDQNGTKQEVQATLRSCFLLEGEAPQSCYPYAAKDFANIKYIPEVVKHVVEKLPADAPGVVCLCNKNNCNQGLDEHAYGSTGKLSVFFNVFVIFLVWVVVQKS